MSSDDFDPFAEAAKAAREAIKDLGMVNVVIAGRSGVGKSTLINAMFSGNFAATGQGRPVTSETREYSKTGSPLRLLDTRGLEMEQYEQTVRELEQLILARRRDQDSNNHVHIAWVCIGEDSRRVETAESKLVEMFDRVGVPPVGVITKARADRGFEREVQRLLPGARNIIRVRAIGEELDDGHAIPPMNLKELAELTFQILPEGQRNAFVAAQKANLDLKRKRSHMVVATAALAAAGIGAAPIPFADAFLLVPVQITMLAQISAVFGLTIETGTLATIASSAVTGLGATAAGRSIVMGLLKLVPGINLAASAISGATAGALTTAFGEIYITVLSALMESSGGEQPSAEEVSKAVADALRRRVL